MSDETPEANRLESLLLNGIFALVAVGLLALIGKATGRGVASGGWWTRPALAPGFALVLLVGANIFTLGRAIVDLRARPPSAEEWRDARTRVLGWLRPLELLAYFGLYLWLTIHIGYFLATFAFVMWLMLRTGLNSPRWLLAGAALTVALVLIFRVGLGVWMPSPGYYDAAPEAVRSYLIRWF
ncbi:tripartite tricarboxylate transporter TctB family protein [Gemmobacter lutimaris]|uniref:Tripartite tricarboxylate transporter TctB family protein n=1 Tax=Gemmobacter lutimaris TaxID=2306023 RepID=A0A398BRK1_9RHOB|nr:tripartite tricarboxylate transporter TctB family protein [Gemmobacter lutimaris]RID89806.1 tripartite tricarboxylate transporter TctB family protein [Gemmobacter lutimaris]